MICKSMNNVTSLIGRAACAIGIHAPVRREKWTPSISAEIVTEFEQTHFCRSCGKTLHHERLKWDGENMVPVSH